MPELQILNMPNIWFVQTAYAFLSFSTVGQAERSCGFCLLLPLATKRKHLVRYKECQLSPSGEIHLHLSRLSSSQGLIISGAVC